MGLFDKLWSDARKAIAKEAGKVAGLETAAEMLRAGASAKEIGEAVKAQAQSAAQVAVEQATRGKVAEQVIAQGGGGAELQAEARSAALKAKVIPLAVVGVALTALGGILWWRKKRR